MLIQEIMNTQPITVEADCCIKTAVPLMSSAGCSCLIIVDKKKAIGIVTERDITKLFCKMLEDSHYPEHPISEVMTPSPVSVQQNSLINDALMLSRSRKLRHLPVVDENDYLVGVVTQTNLVDAYVKLIDVHAELETSVEELKLLSMEDALTGIGNRRAMEVDLAHTE
jgi:CBS domain-containing protein